MHLVEGVMLGACTCTNSMIDKRHARLPSSNLQREDGKEIRVNLQQVQHHVFGNTTTRDKNNKRTVFCSESR